MHSPTIDELTSPNSSQELPEKDSSNYINGKSEETVRQCPNSPTIDEWNSSTSTNKTTPSNRRTRHSLKTPTNGEQSDSHVTPRKRSCRKAKLEAMDKSLAQTLSSRARTPRKSQTNNSLTTGTKSTHEKSNSDEGGDGKAHSTAFDDEKNKSISSLASESPIQRKSKPQVKRPNKRKSQVMDIRNENEVKIKKAASDEALNHTTIVEYAQHATDTACKASVSKMKSNESNDEKDSESDNMDQVFTSTPNDPARKKRVWDTSWFDDEAMPKPINLASGSDKIDKESEEDALSSCFTGSQKTFSGLSSEEESDDDLPDVLGSSITNSTIAKGDLIWLKYGSYPFWPAIVRVVYKVKKQVKKITVAFIGDIKACMGYQHLRVGYKKQNVYPFASCGQAQHDALKQEGLKSQYRVDFQEAYDKAQGYLFKKATDESIDIFQYFSPLFKSVKVHASTSVCDINEDETLDKTLIEKPPGTPDSSNTSEHENEQSPAFSSPGMTKATQQRILSRTLKNQQLVEYIKQDECKGHLLEIFKGEFQSERHKLFFQQKRSKEENNKLRLGGYGPIAEVDQQEEVNDIVIRYVQEWKKEGDEMLRLTDYCLCVLSPEAIIFAIQKVFRQSRTKAEETFYKGAKFFKEEQRQMARQFDRHVKSSSLDSESESEGETQS